MTVFRMRPLPEGAARGHLIVPEGIAASTLGALRAFRGEDRRHEGLVYWAGRRVDGDAVVAAAIVPECEHGPQRVLASPSEIGRISRLARRARLTIVAQVHSHPGDDTRHSDGDDHLVLMPFEGMYSLVVGRYGDGSVRPEEGAGLHQYQGDRWTRIVASESAPALILVPEVIGGLHDHAR